MPTLPDVTSLGTPSGSSAGRGSAGYGAPAFAHPIAPVEPVKYAPVEAPVVDTGAGLKAAGQGLEKAASALAYTYGHLVADQRKKDFATADSHYITESGKINTAINQSSNIDEIRKYRESFPLLAKEAAANLPEDQQELYILKQSRYVSEDQARADQRIYSVTKADDISAYGATLNDLAKEYSISQDTAKRAYIHDTAGTLYDQLAAKGYYTPEQIEEYKNKWTIGAVKDRHDLLPPEQRITSLGGVLPGKIAATDIPQHGAALLVAIGAPESNGKYNVRYTPNGGVEFSDLSKHPNIREKILHGPHAGETSDAAGRYQFLSSTWYGKDGNPGVAQLIGAKDFSEQSQDRGAWYLAQDDYFARTRGRSLDADLKTNGLTPEILSKLADTWEGLKVNPKKAIAAYNATMSGRTDVTAMMDSGDREASVLPIDTRLRMLTQAISEQNRITSEQAAANKDLERTMKDDVDMVAQTGLPMNGLRERVATTLGNDAAIYLDTQREYASAYFSAAKAMETAPDTDLDKIVSGLLPMNESPNYFNQKHWYDLAVKKSDEIKLQRSKDPVAAVDSSPIVKQAFETYDPANPATFQNVVKARLAAQSDLGILKELQNVMPDSEAKRYASVMRPMTQGQANLMLQKELIAGVLNDVKNRYGDYTPIAWRQINSHVQIKGDVGKYLDYVSNQLAQNKSVAPPTPQQSESIQQERNASRAASIGGIQPPQTQATSTSNTSPTQQPVRMIVPDVGAINLLRSDPERYMPFFLKKNGWVDYVPADLIQYVPPEELKKRKVWYPGSSNQAEAPND